MTRFSCFKSCSDYWEDDRRFGQTTPGRQDPNGAVSDAAAWALRSGAAQIDRGKKVGTSYRCLQLKLKALLMEVTAVGRYFSLSGFSLFAKDPYSRMWERKRYNS